MKKVVAEEIRQGPDTREENMDERIGRAYKDRRIIDHENIGVNETDNFFIREFRAENFSVFCLCYEQDGLFLTEPDGRYARDYLSYEEAVQAARRIVRYDENAHLWDKGGSDCHCLHNKEGDMRLKKEDVVVDTAQQHKEKNVWWGDYPAKNIHTDRKLTKSLRHYFSSWEEYMQTHHNSDDNGRR